VKRDHLFRHSAQEGLRIGPFLDLLTKAGPSDGTDPASSAAASNGQGSLSANH
jgi:hypothetical protein